MQVTGQPFLESVCYVDSVSPLLSTTTLHIVLLSFLLFFFIFNDHLCLFCPLIFHFISLSNICSIAAPSALWWRPHRNSTDCLNGLLRSFDWMRICFFYDIIEMPTTSLIMNRLFRSTLWLSLPLYLTQSIYLSIYQSIYMIYLSPFLSP